jgi:hypothetical protein
MLFVRGATWRRFGEYSDCSGLLDRALRKPRPLQGEA